MNMWDSDGDGFLEFDDCLGKGNALGLETVDVSSGSHRFSQCDKDYSVYTTFNRANYPQKDEGTDMIWYKLSGYYTIWADDGSGTFYEPYGYLKFNVGSRSINQGFVVWDVPRDYDSAIRNEHNQTFPFAIYFREAKDFMQSAEKITALGYAKENDGIGHDDGIGNWDGHQWSVNALEEGQYYSNDFPSNGHWAQIKLSLTAIGVVAEPTPEKVEYGLDVKMTFWCDSDKGGSYEAYGDLSVNFGSLAENQRVQLWYRKEGNNIVRDEGESYTDYMYHTFMESPDFIDAEQTTSKVTTLNKIWEDDNSGDDTIGDYNGYQFKPSDLIGNTDYTEFRYDKHNWVRLTLTVTPLTSSDSVLNEYGLEGTLYMIENEDSGTNYEAYGYVNVDTGNKLSNKNREMWRRQPSNHLSIKKGTGHTIKLNDIKFYERSGFIKETSKQTLLVHGYVKEDDNNGEDKYIGNYEGLSLPAHELARPQGITRTFASDGGSGGRVVLKLKLRNYTKERGAEEAKDREVLAKKEAEKKKTDKKRNDTPVQKEKKEL
ncbi:uncharacterized protein [Clytia hemisphaerica]|uniref:Uncharacterized protein n=1 Tax=Clytia hemisphaerica TaxID=252671 RepID=A0A7M5V5C4_9CNID